MHNPKHNEDDNDPYDYSQYNKFNHHNDLSKTSSAYDKCATL